MMRKTLLTLSALYFTATFAQNPTPEISDDLREYAIDLESGFQSISEERKETLNQIAEVLVESRNDSSGLQILFICTHNSRRSHMADLWFKFGTLYYGLTNYDSYSGGTEATAFHPNAIESIKRAGFRVRYSSRYENPIVHITPGGSYPLWQMSSKKYNSAANPQTGFVAVMVCSDADRSCPIVDGAYARFGLTYDDPRYYDDAPSRDEKYDNTLKLIGTEIFYLTYQIKRREIELREASKN